MGLITVLFWGDRDLGLGLDLWDFGGWTLLIFFLGGEGSGLFLNSWGPKFIWLFLLIFFLLFFLILFFSYFPIFLNIFFIDLFGGGFGVGNLLIFVQHSLIHSHNFFHVLWVSVSVRWCAFFWGGLSNIS